MEIVVAQDVVKTYRTGVGRARVREMIPPPFDRALQRVFREWWLRDTFNALDGLSLGVPKGSAIGLVGHNGAGKTTLLKLIAGVTAPTSGAVMTSGRVAALLDVTAGFHPELTGRENLYVAAGMYGLDRRDVLARMDRILDFTELGELIETPVKRYSAGMWARLGFGMVSAIDADLLLIDEVLAVGDSEFQRKCVEWLDGYRQRGGTLLFVSHNLGLVRHMTDRVVWLDHGVILADGPTNQVLGEYARATERRRDQANERDQHSARKLMRVTGLDRWGRGGVRVAEADVRQTAATGRSLIVTMKYEASSTREALFSVGFIDESGFEVGSSLSPHFQLESDVGAVCWEIQQLPLRAGIYYPVMSILSPQGDILDRWKLERAVVLDVNGGPDVRAELGPAEFRGSWIGTP